MIDYTQPLDQLPDPLPIGPLPRPFDATVTPPGSKSLTCRAYVLAALADGESRIVRPLRADDTDGLLAALCTLGARARREGDDVLITGVSGRFPRGGAINLGDGGAPSRFMIAAACLAAEPVIVDGSERMRQRPVAEGVDFLRRLGARIEYVGADQRLPVRVVPGDSLEGGRLEVPTTLSSQFISALLLIGPFLPRGIHLALTGPVTSSGYITLTEQVLSQWSPACETCRTLAISGSRGVAGEAAPELHVEAHAIPAREYRVEPDASSGVYWMIAAAVSPGSTVHLPGLESQSSQPDLKIVGPLMEAGVVVQAIESGLMAQGTERFTGFDDVDASEMPDAALALGAAAAMAAQPSLIRGLHTLPLKETDRLGALAAELARIGCTVTTTVDSIRVDPSTRHDEPVAIETYNDHRMAMAFGVIGPARAGVSIRNPACVSKSYPTFWRDFARLYD